MSVLVVEDEPSVLGIMRRLLENSGYSVITAAQVDEALDAFAGHPDIYLLIADVNLKFESGFELARELLKIKPNLKILFTSGWDEEIKDQLRFNRFECVFLRKPFTAESFRSAVQESLRVVPGQKLHASRTSTP